jgi:hypothetical protein
VSPWALTYGPAAACVASAWRVGWRFLSAHDLVTDDGTQVDLRRDPPAFVVKLVRESVRRWRWKRIEAAYSSLKQGDGGFGAMVQPVFSMCRSRKKVPGWDSATKGALLSTMANRQWPQQRLHSARMVTSPNCRLCLVLGFCDEEDPDPQWEGTLLHRTWTCKASEPHRKASVPGWLLQEVHGRISSEYTMSQADLLFFTKGLAPSLVPQFPAQPIEESFE